MSGGICFSWVQVEFLFLGGIVEMAAEDKSSKFVVLKSIHQDLLVSLVSLVIEYQDAPQAVQNPALFIVVVQFKVLVDGV